MPRNKISRKHTLTHFSLKCKQSVCSPRIVNPSVNSCNTVARKVQCLIAEFKSLKEPIDRVKALLHYATLLPFLDESIRSEENKVPGCTAQVWLEVKMDFEGFMRFRVDSDSEITKGFASCLIWLLDGATPEEVVGVKAEDLAEMNVGILPANSRVNTWNTVLISMQKRTIALVEQRFGDSAKSLALLNCK
ncbi:sufE-like protein 2, chloroplastic [Apium graveolens]